jgi:hypothetical protein
LGLTRRHRIITLFAQRKGFLMNTKTCEVVVRLALLLYLLMPVTANATGYTLTVSSQGSGTVTKDPTNTTYPAGVTVILTATPNAGSYFANWSGDASGTNNPLNVIMNSDLVITGNFLPFPIYTLTLATNGQGTIALNPPGGSYQSNSVVAATATPAAGWVFTSWSDSTNSSANPLSLTMNTNNSLTGNFAQLPAFDLQPLGVTNLVGSTVSFSAHAIGTAPVAYQWFFSSGSLTNATNAMLSLTNVSSGQAGNYFVVATNNYGGATSSVVLLALTNAVGPTNVVNSPDEASLRAAIKIGGWVGLAFNGTITITNTINLTNNVILDASGVSATISGGNAVRLFYVAPGVTFAATNLTLANGSCIVTNVPADAGAVYNDGGIVMLVSCTLTNNTAQSLTNGGVARGGAIFNNGGILSLFACGISNNTVVGGAAPDSFLNVGGSGFGGAIFTTNGTFNIVNCALNNNLCSTVGGPSGVCFGGALFQSSGSLAITNSVFAGNLALGGNSPSPPGPAPGPIPAYCGAIAAISGVTVIDHSQFIGNTARGGSNGYHTTTAPAFGGAVYCASGATIGNSTFFGNQALSGNGAYPYVPITDGNGGAIYNLGSVVLNSCSICSNYTQGGYGIAYALQPAPGGNGFGGGIFNAAQLAATNCTIALNAAVSGSGTSGGGVNGNAIGGGIYNYSSATFIAMNITIASNYCIANGTGFSGTNGFAAGTQIANTNGTLRLHNSIVAYGGTNGNAYGTITDDGYNISSDGTAQLFGGSSYNFTDPKLGPLANYGGPTLCMALLSNSPAIDFGGSSGIPNTDQRGYVRPFGAGPDIGAFEYGSYFPNIVYLNIASTANGVVLSFPASATNSYRLQASTNLSTWTDLNTNGPFGVSTNISQTIGRQGLNLRFFRLLVQ